MRGIRNMEGKNSIKGRKCAKSTNASCIPGERGLKLFAEITYRARIIRVIKSHKLCNTHRSSIKRKLLNAAHTQLVYIDSGALCYECERRCYHVIVIRKVIRNFDVYAIVQHRARWYSSESGNFLGRADIL